MSTILEGITGGHVLLATVAIINVFLGVWLNQTKNDKPLKSFSNSNKGRENAVNRKWKGKYYVIDYLEADLTSCAINEVNITVDLNSKGKIVEGEAIYEYCGSTTLKLRGGFRTDSELYLDYDNEKKNVINYGHMLLKLNGNGDKLSGYLLGRGRNPDCPLVAKIELE